MVSSWLGCLARAIPLFFIIRAAVAQTTPTPDEFALALKDCAAKQNIELGQDNIDSIIKLYSGPNSRAILRDSSEFLSLFPDVKRINAFRLYADCIMVIAPTVTKQSPATPPQLASTTFRICTGEYERACQAHDVYLYCGASIEAWAKDKCTSYQVLRLNTYGGNKCGYSIDQLVCEGPK
jgi:hypothetical protein